MSKFRGGGMMEWKTAFKNVNFQRRRKNFFGGKLKEMSI
jgi:hypothetical protein